MDLWIGTSGYSYPDWVGTFYPPGTSSERMLPVYCRHFPLVELNFTFYRTPTPAMLTCLPDKAPPGFQFLVKVPRSISHEQSDQDLPGFRDAVLQLRQRGQLLGLLLQLPQSTHYGRDNVRWLEKLGHNLQGLPTAVEFRHRSWDRPGLEKWMGEQRLDVVSVDVPYLPGLFPRGWRQSSGRVYVRLHSRNAGNWYGSDKERYDYDYPDVALNEWLDALEHAPAATEQVLFLFNNCHRSQAAVNAQRLRALLGERGTQANVVPPFTDPVLQQRTLFS
jgi:uncharacterized protein YecE (DUF72 family)